MLQTTQFGRIKSGSLCTGSTTQVAAIAGAKDIIFGTQDQGSASPKHRASWQISGQLGIVIDSSVECAMAFKDED